MKPAIKDLQLTGASCIAETDTAECWSIWIDDAPSEKHNSISLLPLSLGPADFEYAVHIQ
jgi:hypothetical protein